MNPGQEELRNEISAIRDKINTDMSALRPRQAELGEKMTETLNKQLMGITTMVKQ
jgi:hypothetical protein